MSSLIRDFSDEQLTGALQKWMSQESANWQLPLALLVEISNRHKTAFPKETYLQVLRRIAALKPTLSGREEKFFPADFAVPLNELQSLLKEANKDLTVISLESDGQNRSFSEAQRYDVPIINTAERFDQQVDRLLSGILPQFKAATSGRTVAFGSCFAVNVAKYLRERGKSVYTLMVAEDVNSPFNNLQLLRAIFEKERTPISEELELLRDLNFDGMRAEFAGAGGIIFTLGNIFHLEIDGYPTLNFRKGAEVVAEKLEETINHLRATLALLRKHSQATIFVSISPIPILGYRGDRFRTAIEADFLSKSQLRAALFVCQQEFPELIYVPTFEIFRSLPPYETFASFGTEDGISRHIASDLIKRVMEKLGQ